MKYQYSLIAISLALAGCGGDSSSSSGNTVTPTYDVAGTIASRGTLLDTTVCIDENQNYQCDSNEPAAKSDKQTCSTNTSGVIERAILNI